jgi:alpha-glucosidase
VDLRETQVLHGDIGVYLTIWRQVRHSLVWFLGSLTEEHGRSLYYPLTFLSPDQTYVAEIYAVALEANWDSNPLAIDIQQVLVNNETVMNLQLAPGGGQAIRFRPATATEAESLPFYTP